MNVSIRDILKVYWQELRKHALILSVMIVALVAATCLELGVPLYLKRFFDVLAKGNPTDPQTLSALWHAIVMTFVLNACAWVLYRIASFSNDYVIPQIMKDLYQRSYNYLQYHSLRFFSDSFVGSLVKKITRFARAFEIFAGKTIWNIIPIIVRVTGVVIVMSTFNTTIALLLIGWVVLYMIINYFFSMYKLQYDTLKAKADSHTTGVIADAITNHANIHLFNGFDFEAHRLTEALGEYCRLRTITWSLDDVSESIQAGLMISLEFGLMVVAVKYWKMGALTLGTFVLIQSYLIQVFNRLWDFGRVVRDLYESIADAREMVEILLKPHEIQDTPTAKPLVIRGGEIELRNVRFSYNETRTVIHGIHLRIKPGEKVAIIGPSGSGKSTIVKLLFRLYDIDSGKILIDGQKIHTVTQQSLHENLSLVPQDPVLFHRPLKENIRYGARDATDEQVIAAAKLAHCHEFISEFQEKYDTYVGERGVKLSGGERQRVAIARAILRNAPILVLDEATSSLDSESESLIQDALKTLMKDKTSIVIAHRLSTIQQMDRIIVMDQGKIIEEGTHTTLLKTKNSLYKRLWELQAGGFLP